MKGEVGTSIFYFNFNFQTKYKKLLLEDLTNQLLIFQYLTLKKNINTRISLKTNFQLSNKINAKVSLDFHRKEIKSG